MLIRFDIQFYRSSEFYLFGLENDKIRIVKLEFTDDPVLKNRFEIQIKILKFKNYLSQSIGTRESTHNR